MFNAVEGALAAKQFEVENRYTLIPNGPRNVTQAGPFDK